MKVTSEECSAIRHNAAMSQVFDQTLNLGASLDIAASDFVNKKLREAYKEIIDKWESFNSNTELFMWILEQSEEGSNDS